MKRTRDFKLGEIANDFRFHFIRILSDAAYANRWKSTNKVETNKEQNAFYFEQQIQYDTGRVIEMVYRDIQDTLRTLKEFGFEFDVKTIKKGYSVEVTNIGWSEK